MDEEYIRRKYRYLYSNVCHIRNELYDIGDTYKDLKNSLKKSLLIDGNIPDADIFAKMQNDTNGVINELNNTVLPRITQKM